MELSINNITQKYGEKVALDDFSVTFNPGVYGILGANGAGKTTLMNLITDNLKRTEGEILWNGVDILKLKEKFRQKVGYMPQQQGMYDNFSARMLIMYMASLKGVDKKAAREEMEQLLDVVNLKDVANQKVGSFSGGMKQRVLLAQALLGEPEVLILDEPTAGLDPKERISIRNFISELSKDKIIIFATHVVSDIECIADQVLIVKKGKLIGMGTPVELIDSLQGHVAERICTKEELPKLQEKYPIHRLFQKKEGLVFRIVGDEFPEDFQLTNADISLEDVYLYYVEG